MGSIPILLPQKIKSKRNFFIILISSISGIFPPVAKWFAQGIFKEWVFSNMLAQIPSIPTIAWLSIPILGVCLVFVWSFLEARAERRNPTMYIPRLLLELYKYTFKLKDKVVRGATDYSIYVNKESEKMYKVSQKSAIAVN